MNHQQFFVLRCKALQANIKAALVKQRQTASYRRMAKGRKALAEAKAALAAASKPHKPLAEARVSLLKAQQCCCVPHQPPKEN